MTAPAPYTIVARSEIGVPDPRGRPMLRLNLEAQLCHYVGAGHYDDPSKDWAYARQIATYGIGAGKTWEYNYLIGLGGTIFEQAGDHVGAHCLNFNDRSVGVLMMLGINVAPTVAMMDAWRWLVWRNKSTGRLAQTAQLAPHYRYRTTSCCGTTLANAPGAAWISPTRQGSAGILRPELLAPWVPPDTKEDPDMGNARLVRDPRYVNVWLIGCGPALNLPQELVDTFTADGVEIRVVEHDQMLKGLLFQSGLTRADLIAK